MFRDFLSRSFFVSPHNYIFWNLSIIGKVALKKKYLPFISIDDIIIKLDNDINIFFKTFIVSNAVMVLSNVSLKWLLYIFWVKINKDLKNWFLSLFNSFGLKYMYILNYILFMFLTCWTFFCAMLFTLFFLLSPLKKKNTDYRRKTKFVLYLIRWYKPLS